MEEGKQLSREEIAERLREIHTDTGGFVKAIAKAIGTAWVNDAGMQGRLYDIKHRLADLIEGAPVKPSEDARELSKELRDNLERDASRSILLTSNPPKRPFSPYVAVENYLDFANRIERIGAPVESNANVRELAEKVRKIYSGNCRDAIKELGLKCSDYSYCMTCLKGASNKIADEIEHIAAPDMSRYVELPVDKDGLPIRPGDTLYNTLGDQQTVFSIDFFENTRVPCINVLTVNKHGIVEETDVDYFTHVKPRTLEDVLYDVDLMTDEEDERDREQFREFVREAYELGHKEAAR